MERSFEKKKKKIGKERGSTKYSRNLVVGTFSECGLFWGVGVDNVDRESSRNMILCICI